MYSDTLTSGLSYVHVYCISLHVHVHLIIFIHIHIGVTRKHEFGRSSTSKKGLVRKASFNTRPYLHQYEIQGTCTVQVCTYTLHVIHVHGSEKN